MNSKTSRLALLVALALGSGACMMGYDDATAGYDDEGGYYEEGDGNGGAADDGSAEPLDPESDPQEAAPPPDECDASEAVTLYLSPDDSNSMSSPVQAREAVLHSFSSLGQVPIRTWEFMNYYSFDYPAAEPGGVQVHTSLMVPEGAGEGEYTLQIAVSSEHLEPTERAPLNITLVLDTSGSMEGHAMDMLKATSHAIAGSLQEGDIVSIVTWSTDDEAVLSGHAVGGPGDLTLLQAIDALQPGGGTDLHGGLTAGYDQAKRSYDVDRINRIVLISDGGANAGITDVDIIAENAGGNDSDGIYMVGVGVGSSSTYNDDLMDAVTDAGKGASVFINDALEAQRIFGDQFISTLDVAVRDVSVSLEMPPGFSVVRFSGEEISSDPSEVEPQHLAPNDSMVFHQQIETCAPELLDEQSTFTVAVHYRDGTTFEQHEIRTQVSFRELLDARDPLLLKGAAVFAYAEALGAYPNGDDARQQALKALARAEEANPEDPDLAEIRLVLESL